MLNFGGSKPASTFTLATTTAASSLPAPAPGGFSFGTVGAGGDKTLNLSTKPAAPASGLGTTGFSLGGTAASAPAPMLNFGLSTASTPSLGGLGAPAAPASSAPPQFSFGGTASTAASFTPIASTGLSTGGTSAAPPLFGAPAASTGIKTTLAASLGTSTSTAPKLSFSLPSTTVAPSVSTSTTTLGAPTAAPLATTGSLTYNQIEDAINKWTIDLEEQGKHFINQAKQLNAWDTLLIQNGDKILNLNSSIEKVKGQQSQLDQELDFVLAQQKELEELISPLEKELGQLPPSSDHERNRTYQLAESMDSQLKQMTEDLKGIIEHLNETNKEEDANDPVNQISRILNAHMNSLQWIDTNTAQISNYLSQISKMQDINRRIDM